MLNYENISEIEKKHLGDLSCGILIKKVYRGLRCASFVVAMSVLGLSAINGIDIINANNNTNKIVDLYNAGKMDESENALENMARYIRSNDEKAAFSQMSTGEKLAYIQDLISNRVKKELIGASLAIVSSLALAILSKLSEKDLEKIDEDIDKEIISIYEDEKCSPEFKRLFMQNDAERVLKYINMEKRYLKTREKKVRATAIEEKYLPYGDYYLGYKKGQSDFYSRCNFGSGNIYEKAMFYFGKGLSPEKIDKKLTEVSYKRGFFRSAGLYVANTFALGKELSPEEQEIFSNMENLSLDNVMNIDKYSASEVKDRAEFWHGYVEGFKNEINSPFSSMDYDLHELSQEARDLISEKLDTNSYKNAFLNGVLDGIFDLTERVEKKQATKEQTI